MHVNKVIDFDGDLSDPVLWWSRAGPRTHPVYFSCWGLEWALGLDSVVWLPVQPPDLLTFHSDFEQIMSHWSWFLLPAIITRKDRKWRMRRWNLRQMCAIPKMFLTLKDQSQDICCVLFWHLIAFWRSCTLAPCVWTRATHKLRRWFNTGV